MLSYFAADVVVLHLLMCWVVHVLVMLCPGYVKVLCRVMKCVLHMYVLCSTCSCYVLF